MHSEKSESAFLSHREVCTYRSSFENFVSIKIYERQNCANPGLHVIHSIHEFIDSYVKSSKKIAYCECCHHLSNRLVVKTGGEDTHTGAKKRLCVAKSSSVIIFLFLI